ncbi:DUF3038 domain-containing protein [Romeria aff. gracilis LEGE 07310]|uniref:DUF3038 domain-containing protein n=1 Tax=Vasconcelosia minhoensis LEGE 07310 TaxID=915328 RepID=A0A8J7AQZ7_9CYAN|nr:DUF3038 domain-containing protein [Romeria gracilis]MBE9078984.1 DUF3038 domain-containing protein [Romeria aff. gracilis LEGE 07310]
MTVKRPPDPSAPLLLDQLSAPKLARDECPRRAKTQIDLILLAIEALDLSGSEAMLAAARELELQSVIGGRVGLWRLRGSNPLRRFNQRRPLSLDQAKALVLIASYLSRRLTVIIRQLLLGYQQLSDQQLSVEHHLRLADYLSRFRAHFRARMNAKRASVMAYSSDEKLNQLALNLLMQLLFCTGTSGAQRLWSSLFDGEVA